jgi:lysophospholipase L1-like esterase
MAPRHFDCNFRPKTGYQFRERGTLLVEKTMTRGLISVLCSLFAVSLFAGVARAQATAAPAAPSAAPATRPANRGGGQPEAADVPSIKMGNDHGVGFIRRHVGFINDRRAMDGRVGLLFVGDSITDGWRNFGPRGGRDVFEQAYGKYRPLNIGIGGDRTQHVLWRLDADEVAGISPKVAVVMIGTNNLGSNSNEEIAAADAKIVQSLRAKLPNTKVLLLGIFPRDEKPDTNNRNRIKAINAELAKLDDGGRTVKYLDIGDKFLEPDGTLPRQNGTMSDALHPNAKGYQIWADAMQPALEELMK